MPTAKALNGLSGSSRLVGLKGFIGLRAMCAAATCLAVVHSAGAQPPAPAPSGCAEATTQARMNECAYENFLSAQATYSRSNQALSSTLPAAQRALLRRAQTAWLAYRTAACEFESSATQGGSVQAMVRWQCAARMTREHVSALATWGRCEEGDVSCVERGK